MYEVKDGPRTLQFDGQLLGQSSSWRRDSFRWIEFKLYKTNGGQYVLSRVGVSLVFHGAACPLVARYSLQEVDPDTLDDAATPCPECRPTFTLPVVFPEKFRHWALTSTDAGAVLDALYKEDDNGSRYLTKVAERLLEQASQIDPDLDLAYRIEIIL